MANEPAEREPLPTIWRVSDELWAEIEPIISERPCRAVDDRDGWTIRTSNGSLSAHYEETIVITSGAPIVLTALPA